MECVVMWAEKFTTEYARPDTTAVTKDQHKAGKHTTMLRAWFEQHLGEWVTQTEILRMLGISRHTAEPFLTQLEYEDVPFVLVEGRQQNGRACYMAVAKKELMK